MTVTVEDRSSEVIKCANCSGPLKSECESDSLESPVLAFDSFVHNNHVRVTLRNALGQVFGVRDLEECHFCVHCCLIFSQLYGLFHLLGARRREDALLASKLKQLGLIGQNFENQDDQVEVEICDADGLVSFRNASDSIEFDPGFDDLEPAAAEQDDSRPASPMSDHEQSFAREQREEPPFDEVIDPDAISAAILQQVTQNGQRILYKCCDCQEGFPHLQNFINHRLSSHPSVSALDLFKCIVCSEVCKEQTEFREHLFYHCRSAKRKLFPCCDVCGRRYVIRRLVNEHHKAAHLGKEKPKSRRRCEPWDYKCSDCGEVLKGLKSLQNHRRTFHSKRRRKQKQQIRGNEGTESVGEIIGQLEDSTGNDQASDNICEEINSPTEDSTDPTADSARAVQDTVDMSADIAATIKQDSEEGGNRRTRRSVRLRNEPKTDVTAAADAEANIDGANDAAADAGANSEGTKDAPADAGANSEGTKDAPAAANAQNADDSASEFNPSSSSESEESEDSASSSSEDESPKPKKTRLDTPSASRPKKTTFGPRKRPGRRPKNPPGYAGSTKNRTERPRPNPTFHCNDCNLPLSTPGAVARHKREVHGVVLKPYQCHHCPAAFNHDSLLRGHIIRKHMNERPFSCHKCSASFPLLHNLKKHMQHAHMELLVTRLGTKHEREYSEIYKRIYLCADCDQMLESVDAYVEHAKSVHEKIHECPQCRTCCANIKNFEAHMAKHERNLECDFCDKEFRDAATLKRHMTTSHADGLGGEKDLPDEAFKESYDPERDLITDKFHCPECTEQFIKLKEIVDHIGMAHPDRLKCWCPVCEAKALNKTQLMEHLKMVHKLQLCPHCNILFKYLWKHMNDYHREDVEQEKVVRQIRATIPYKERRKEQDKKAAQARLMERDQRLVATAKSVYQCADCDQSFGLPKTFREHRSSAHPNEPMHKCHLCLFVSTGSTGVFKQHVHAHNESNDWPCGQPDCTRRFLKRSYRDAHLLEVHGIKKHPEDCYPLPISQSLQFITGQGAKASTAAEVMNYNCVDCEAEFTIIYHLGRHRREVHKVPAEKEWICHVCQKVMLSAGSLRNHMTRHKEVKDILCDECGKCFGTKADLQQHRKLIHDPVGRVKLKEVWRKSKERRKLATDGGGGSRQPRRVQGKTGVQAGRARNEFEDESSMQESSDDESETEESVTYVLLDDDGIVD